MKEVATHAFSCVVSGVSGKRNWPEIDLDPARYGFLGVPQLSTDNNDDDGGDDSNDPRRTNSKACSNTAGNSGTGSSNRMDNIRSSPARTQPRSTLAHRNARLK